MAMQMIGWFGDGNGYVGNLDLKPEKAHTVSFTAGWHDPAQRVWDVKVTPYASYVQDHIDVDRCASASCLASNPANLMTTTGFVYLQFANHDATLYGVNVEGRLTVWDNPVYGQGQLRGLIGYVRGQRTDGVDLYHMMPINAKLALDHRLGGWSNSIELQLVGALFQCATKRQFLTGPNATRQRVQLRRVAHRPLDSSIAPSTRLRIFREPGRRAEHHGMQLAGTELTTDVPECEEWDQRDKQDHRDAYDPG